MPGPVDGRGGSAERTGTTPQDQSREPDADDDAPDPLVPRIAPDGYGDSDHDDVDAPGVDLPVMPPHPT